MISKRRISAGMLAAAFLLSFALISYQPAGTELPFDNPRDNVIRIWTVQDGTFRLPASLRVVEEEAFLGTAAERLIFDDQVAEIRDAAFGETERLESVLMPSSVQRADESAFGNRKNLTILGEAGSIAEEWAREHHIPFMRIDVWLARAIGQQDNDQRTEKQRTRGWISESQNLDALTSVHSWNRSPIEYISGKREERAELNHLNGLFP